MRSEDIYAALMERARKRGRPDGYFERHHVKPKSLFPELRNDPSNIVMLTAREHFIAHLLLARIHGGIMAFAAHAMSLNGRYGSRSYERLRMESSAFLSEARRGKGNPMFGKKLSPEHVSKILQTKKGRQNGQPSPLKGRKLSDDHRARIAAATAGTANPFHGRTHSEESRRKISAAKMGSPSPRKGVKLSREQRRHLSDINTGKTMPDDVRSRISASLKGRPKPPRTEEHKRNLAEANRRRAERERNAKILA